MAKRTLQSCWKQYEKFANDYLKQNKSAEECQQKLNELTEKVNEDKIGTNLFTIFVEPHLPLDMDVVFDSDLSEGLPEWQTKYDQDKKLIMINPVSVVKFINEAKAVEIKEEDYEDFLHLRYISFLKELSKLPSIFILFMLLLQRTAYLLEVAHLEKRGGIVEVAEGEAYHTLLWAFKELENLGPKLGKNVRSDFGVLWYESEWITGR